ncbi:MAG: M13 family metallopeptidase [Acidobacteriota bacterium]
MRKLLPVSALAAISLCASLAIAAEPARKSAAEVAAGVLASIDRSVDPCVDFYAYACGSWMKNTTIPGDRSRWGRGFSEIAERNLTTLRAILDESATKGGSNPDLAKLGTYYGSCMNEAAIDAAGAKPLAPLMTIIKTAADKPSLMTAIGKLSPLGVQALFSGFVGADYKDPNKNILIMVQGGGGLPDRSYYLEPGYATIREGYTALIAKLLELAGSSADAAKQDSTKILAFETELAKISQERAELRDPDKTYNKLNRDGLQKLTPSLPWDKLFAAAGYPDIKEINVMTPAFFSGLEKLLQSTDANTLQAYLRWQAVRSSANTLSKPFVDASFEFYGKTLSGQREQQARWKRCVNATDGALGDILGKIFVERMFPGESKTIALDMIHRVEASFVAGLPQLSWMDDATREAAKQKASMVANKIGYPDKWIDYSSVKLVPGDYFANALTAAKFEFDRELKKVGQPVDKTEWGMTTPTVNAYYNPLNNEMAFPAGIMQAPFFDRDYSVAMNFGGMGMVMGHELTHGFDDDGRKFAGDGQLREWWAPAAAERYEARAQCVRVLYSSYQVQPDLVLNGNLTSGENIADMGGIKIAYRAYREYAKQKPEIKSVAVEGLSDEQLFFTAFAQTWCSLQTPQIEQQLVKVDYHSHPRWRVNGPLSQLPEFAEAFQCKPNQPMNPAERCEVW